MITPVAGILAMILLSTVILWFLGKAFRWIEKR